MVAAVVNGEGEQSMVKANGPILVSMTVSDDGKKAVLTYENVGDGLKTTDGGSEVKGFVLYQKKCAIDTSVPVKAVITAPNQITIECDEEITGIAYNAVTVNVYGVDTNLCNSEGVPAGATVFLKSED